MSHNVQSGCSSPPISHKNKNSPFSNRPFKDGVTPSKLVPTHISKSKEFSSNELRSSNVPKQRISANPIQKETPTVPIKRDIMESSKNFHRTHRHSSSSKSSDSDSISESDSDLSCSSSISSSSDSNSSHTSFSSSLSNSYEQSYASKKARKMELGKSENSKTQRHSFKNSSVSDLEAKSVNIHDKKSSQLTSFPGFQKAPMLVSNKHSIKSHSHRKDKEFSPSDLSKRNDHSTKVYVGNLTRNILRSHLHEIFSNYGTIRRIDFPIDSVSGFNQGYCYIDYENSQSAMDSRNSMDEGYLDGQRVSVQVTYPLNKRDSIGKTAKSLFRPAMLNRSPHHRRNVSSEYRRVRSPLMRRAPARFRRRKRDHSFSSSRSRTRSSSPKHRSSSKRYFSKSLHNSDYRKYSRSCSSHRYTHSLSRRSHRKHRHSSTSSSFSTSSGSR